MIDDVGHLFFASDSFGWAVAATGSAAGAVFGDDAITDAILTDAGGAAFFDNMSFILVAEIADG